MATNIDLSGIFGEVAKAAATAIAKKQDNSLKQAEVPAATKIIEKTMQPAIEKEVTAVITNATNQEPLYKSRNMWTFGFTLLAMAMAAAGYTLSAEDQSKAVDTIMQLMQIVPIIAAGGASLWGMWNRIFVASKKPLGQ
jgi:hypothetical protein